MLSTELTKELQVILKEEYNLDFSQEETFKIGGFILSYAETLLSIKNEIKDTDGSKTNDT